MTNSVTDERLCSCGHRMGSHASDGCHAYTWEPGTGQVVCRCEVVPMVPCSDPECTTCHGSGEYPTGAGYTRAWVPCLVPAPDPDWVIVDRREP